MIIKKCATCLKLSDRLYGDCPIHRTLCLGLFEIGRAFCSMHAPKVYLTVEMEKEIPQEFLDYDFPCKFYIAKPTTGGFSIYG